MSNATENLKAQSNFTFGIRGRILMGFAAILSVFLIAVGIALVKVSMARQHSQAVLSAHLPTYESLLDLTGQLYYSQSSIESVALTKNTKFYSDFVSAWKNINRLELKLDQLSKNWTDLDVKKWENIKSLLNQIKTTQSKIDVKTDNNLQNLPQLLNTEITPLFDKVLDILDGPLNAEGIRVGGMFDNQYNLLYSGAKNVVDDMSSLLIIESLLFILGIILSIFITAITVKKIVKTVNEFSTHSSKIASGELTQRLVVEASNDEMSQLGTNLNTMTDSLSTITKKITEACHNIVTMLSEVTQAVDVQSSGASEQASSINQITASLEEIEKSSTQTIEKTKALGEAAERTRDKGQLGLQAVEESIIGMKAVRDKVQTIAQTILELSNQTQQVGEITAVVNNLAQQSKMLALNASIEAAKAGEAGKGFAVVAAEVKNLAEQSEQSTVQVQKILEDIRYATEKAVMATEEGTKGVDHGTSLVEQTGDIVRSLSEVIHETTVATQQIEAAVRQESIGIEQITAGMNEINQVMSSSVQSVKQTTEAIYHLETISKNLKEYTETYKV